MKTMGKPPRIAPGTDVYERGSGQPAMTNLISNRTVLVQELNPKRAADADAVEVRDVPNLTAAVDAFQPEIDFQVKDTQLTEAGGVQISDVTVTMRYGGDKQDQVIADFKPESLVGKVQGPGDSEMERRVLLRQRLQSQVIEQLLARLNEPKFAEAVSDPQKRLAILATLDQQIAEIEKEMDTHELDDAAGDA
jgi:hypothetical protein